MRAIIAWVLVLSGGAMVLYGLAEALRPLISVYASNLSDPLGQHEASEDSASAAMFRGVILGALGVIPLLLGTIMLKIMFFKKAARRKND